MPLKDNISNHLSIDEFGNVDLFEDLILLKIIAVHSLFYSK